MVLLQPAVSHCSVFSLPISKLDQLKLELDASESARKKLESDKVMDRVLPLAVSELQLSAKMICNNLTYNLLLL